MDISGKAHGPVKFVAGPEPRSSLAPPGAAHSGLLECPATTRLTKVVDTKYTSHVDGDCDEPIFTYHECFYAAATLLAARGGTPPARVLNTTGSDAHRPRGCSVAVVAPLSSSSSSGSSRSRRRPAATAHVFFNTVATSASACSADRWCVCPTDPKPFGEATGAFLYQPTTQAADVGSGYSGRFGGVWKSCAAAPTTILNEQRNPTCDLRHYKGGQWACKHMWSLLDADQPIPWADQPLVFRHKLRFYVQPYRADKHTELRLGETVGLALSKWPTP